MIIREFFLLPSKWCPFPNSSSTRDGGFVSLEEQYSYYMNVDNQARPNQNHASKLAKTDLRDEITSTMDEEKVARAVIDNANTNHQDIIRRMNKMEVAREKEFKETQKSLKKIKRQNADIKRQNADLKRQIAELIDLMLDIKKQLPTTLWA